MLVGISTEFDELAAGEVLEVEKVGPERRRVAERLDLDGAVVLALVPDAVEPDAVDPDAVVPDAA